MCFNPHIFCLTSRLSQLIHQEKKKKETKCASPRIQLFKEMNGNAYYIACMLYVIPGLTTQMDG